MEYAFYMILWAFGFGLLCYGAVKAIVRRKNNNIIASQAVNPIADSDIDDFICILCTDNSTIIGSGNVTVRGYGKPR